MLSSPLAFLRLSAIAEGISYLLFAITMPLKYFMDMPGPNMVVGMAHGFLFLLYIGLVLFCAYRYQWSGKVTLLSLLASIVPAGTFYAHRKWFGSPADGRA